MLSLLGKESVPILLFHVFLYEHTGAKLDALIDHGHSFKCQCRCK